MTIIYIYIYILFPITKQEKKKKESGSFSLWGSDENRVEWGSEKERTELTGGGGSERQRAEEREPSSPAVEEVRDREQRRENRFVEKMRIESSGWEASVFSLNDAVLASPRTEPNRPVPKPYRKIFFLAENGYACSGTSAVSVPTRYPVRVRRGFCRTGAS